MPQHERYINEHSKLCSMPIMRMCIIFKEIVAFCIPHRRGEKSELPMDCHVFVGDGDGGSGRYAVVVYAFNKRHTFHVVRATIIKR